MTVETARGPINTNELGETLMHEHVFVIDVEVAQNYPETWSAETWGAETARMDAAVARLDELHSRGVGTIVDLTVLGLGRHIPRLQRVAARTKLNIIIATGVYTYNDVPNYFMYRGPGTILGGVDPMIEMFVRDIERGIGDTGVKAGVLKCATDEQGLTPGVERVLRATAIAHRQTGVPISTHTHARKHVGLDQQRVFREEGVDLSRVVIGHCGDTNEIAYLEELIGNGSYIGMDRFGIDTIFPFEARVKTVAEMCARGHAKSMVLSHDANCFMHWLPEGFIPQAMPRWHYLHIHNDVLPALRAAGVSDEDIRTMLVENPRRIFERTKKQPPMNADERR